MQKAKQRLTSLVMACVMVIVSMFAAIATLVMPQTTAVAAGTTGSWTLVTNASDLTAGDEIVIVAKGSNAAMSTTQNNNNRGQIAVTIDSDTVVINDSVQVLTLEAGTTSGTFAFNTGSAYLYCASTSSKNYLRTQATKDAKASWKIEIASNGVATVKSQVSGISRNLLSYNQQSSCFACYSSVQKDIYLYKFIATADINPEITEILNNTNAWTNLSYSYNIEETTVDAPAGVTDKLTRSVAEYEGSAYKEWTKTDTSSGAEYAGYNAGGNDSIQLNNNDKGYGIITTKSVGNATKISVEWNTSTTAGRTLNIYGKNEAYESTTDLYNTTKQGELLGTIICGTNTELDLTLKGNFAYIAFTSAKSALYLDSIEITWDNGSSAGTTTKEVLKDSAFKIRFAVDASLADLAGKTNVTEYGICVSNGEDVRYYPSTKDSSTNKCQSIKDESLGELLYVVIGLGNTDDNPDRLGAKFTVQAYVKVTVNGMEETYTSATKKTNSVASMVETYYEMDNYKTAVEHLYNFLDENGII